MLKIINFSSTVLFFFLFNITYFGSLNSQHSLMLNVISKILVYDFKITQVNDWLSDIGRDKPAYIIFVILNNWQNTCYMTKENRKLYIRHLGIL